MKNSYKNYLERILEIRTLDNMLFGLVRFMLLYIDPSLSIFIQLPRFPSAACSSCRPIKQAVEKRKMISFVLFRTKRIIGSIGNQR